MRWYQLLIVMILIGMAYSNQLLGEEHSIEQIPLRLEEDNSENCVKPLRMAGKAVNKRPLEFGFKSGKNNHDDDLLYQTAVNTYYDKIQLKMIGYDKTKRDFQRRYRNFKGNYNSNDVLNVPEKMPLKRFSINKLLVDGSKIDRILYKPEIKKTTNDVPLRASSYIDEDYDGETFKDRDEFGKRGDRSGSMGCDCKVENDLIDLGQQHFPRYLLTAVCQGDVSNDHPSKCRRGSYCKALEYKVKVLTFRNIFERARNDSLSAWLPDDLRQLWKFKTVTIAAGCFCSY